MRAYHQKKKKKSNYSIVNNVDTFKYFLIISVIIAPDVHVISDSI